VLRKAKGKDKAIILDHVGNWSRFGLPDDEREWSLKGKPKGAKEPSKYKRCPECLRPVAVSARKCEWCGYEWMYEAQERMPVEVEGTLVSIKERKEGENQDLYRAISRNAHNLKEAIKIAKEMGYKHNSAFYVWTELLHLAVDSVVY
jgi:superfamily II DNA or RNA helicase